MADSLRPHGLQRPWWTVTTRLLCPWYFSGKNTGVSYHFFLKGIFLTPASSCIGRHILYHLTTWDGQFKCYSHLKDGLPRRLRGKESACQAGDTRDKGSVPGLGRSPGEGKVTHCILAWRVPWTEEPGGLQPMWLQRVRHNWATKQLPPPPHLKDTSQQHLDWCWHQISGCCSLVNYKINHHRWANWRSYLRPSNIVRIIQTNPFTHESMINKNKKYINEKIQLFTNRQLNLFVSGQNI